MERKFVAVISFVDGSCDSGGDDGGDDGDAPPAVVNAVDVPRADDGAGADARGGRLPGRGTLRAPRRRHSRSDAEAEALGLSSTVARLEDFDLALHGRAPGRSRAGVPANNSASAEAESRAMAMIRKIVSCFIPFYG